ncbi:hypothetical protein MUP77_09890 [Candidatus Bathyarchaeota archaeon]|nr:hypothetical protein [Candidatus Bathyarchaeota archaeon]
MKSYRDIKSSLELSKKKIACRTAQTENSIRTKIEGKYGDLSRFTEDVALKEEIRKQRQSLSLERARLKLFMTKEKLGRLQQARSSHLNPKDPPLKQDGPQEKVSHVNDDAPKFRRVELKY